MKCEACGRELDFCGCDTWCDLCGCRTNHSTVSHEQALRAQAEDLDDSDDGEGRVEDGDYDETREGL